MRKKKYKPTMEEVMKYTSQEHLERLIELENKIQISLQILKEHLNRCFCAKIKKQLTLNLEDSYENIF